MLVRDILIKDSPCLNCAVAVFSLNCLMINHYLTAFTVTMNGPIGLGGGGNLPPPNIIAVFAIKHDTIIF